MRCIGWPLPLSESCQQGMACTLLLQLQMQSFRQRTASAPHYPLVQSSQRPFSRTRRRLSGQWRSSSCLPHTAAAPLRRPRSMRLARSPSTMSHLQQADATLLGTAHTSRGLLKPNSARDCTQLVRRRPRRMQTPRGTQSTRAHRSRRMCCHTYLASTLPADRGCCHEGRSDRVHTECTALRQTRSGSCLASRECTGCCAGWQRDCPRCTALAQSNQSCTHAPQDMACSRPRCPSWWHWRSCPQRTATVLQLQSGRTCPARMACTRARLLHSESYLRRKVGTCLCACLVLHYQVGRPQVARGRLGTQSLVHNPCSQQHSRLRCCWGRMCRPRSWLGGAHLSRGDRCSQPGRLCMQWRQPRRQRSPPHKYRTKGCWHWQQSCQGCRRLERWTRPRKRIPLGKIGNLPGWRAPLSC